MFDDIHVRSLINEDDGDVYIHTLDLAQHLVFAAMQLQAHTVANPPANDLIQGMDVGSIETMRMIAQFLLYGEMAEDVNRFDTIEDLQAHFDELDK